MAEELLVQVVRRRAEATDIVGLDLAHADGNTLPEFTAGSHIDVHLAGGLVRQYSLCNAPGDRQAYRIAVLRDAQSRGGSIAVHEGLALGESVWISRPRNNFALVPAEMSLLFAGGIGITPILSMAESLHAEGRAFALHYCGRSSDRMAFHQHLKGRPYAHRVRFHADDGPTAQRLHAANVLTSPTPEMHLYVCGPHGFIQHVKQSAAAAAWSPGNVHEEHFSNMQLARTGDEAFHVQIASTGQRILVAPGESVASALIACGVAVPMSCEQGVCGTCMTRILEGVPDHRDIYFTDAEKAVGDRFTPCCSRSKSPLLVLDL